MNLKTILNLFTNPVTLNNVRSIYNWPFENKNIVLPVIAPIITMIASRAIFNSSYQTSILLSSVTAISTAVDQKYPNAKKTLFEKIKKVANFLIEQHKKVTKHQQEKLKEQQLQTDAEHAILMSSFLRLGREKILQECKENSVFISTCKYFGLSDTLILTLLNIYSLYPDETEKHFKTRLNQFIDLVQDRSKAISLRADPIFAQDEPF